MSATKDIVIVGYPDTLHGRGRVYTVAGTTDAGRRWLKRYFQGPGLGIMGRTFFHLGKKRVVPFVQSVLRSDGITYRTVEL